ncbi:Ribonuclease P/MRP protein subunit POP5 [Grifola frondosa]|uniref:Ribonuclease P/MRP protein subunit POP5 n=1 Tax=Grifola frondosa TaxID=5627 RepID=A0A1C7M605_GRIFR|nr:Ribonuclease P/MRP protein subunit POP5 [Grifola frondosa]
MVRFKVSRQSPVRIGLRSDTRTIHKNRWLLVEFLPCAPPTSSAALATPEMSSKQVWSALKQSILTHFGDTGWGAVAASLTSASLSLSPAPCALTPPAVKYYSPRTNMCIIRVARDQHRIAWAGVTLLSAVDGRRCVPHVVHVSGPSRIWRLYVCVLMGCLCEGTIKQAQIAAIRHNREVVARHRARAKTPGASLMGFPRKGLLTVERPTVAYQDSYEEYLQTSTQEIEALQD